MTILKQLLTAVSTRPHETAMIWQGRSWSNEELWDEVESAASALSTSGLVRGDRVAISLPNGPSLAISLLACLRGGYVAAPINTRFKSGEVQTVLDLIRPRLLVHPVGGSEAVAGLRSETLPCEARVAVDVEGGLEHAFKHIRLACSQGASRHQAIDLAVLLPTSGTTGVPKIVAHTPSTLGAIAERYDAFGLESGDVMMNLSPMVHAGGLFNLLASLVRPGTMVLTGPYDANSILDAVELHSCTWLKALPFVFADLAEAQRRRRRDVSTLRLCLASGDALPVQVHKDFVEAFGLPIFTAWASTEAATGLAYASPGNDGYKVRRGGEARLAQGGPWPGELELRGAHVSPGYWSTAQGVTSHAEGWFRTGDVFRSDVHGSFAFVARAKNLIVRAGSNISPLEVEDSLRSLPDVIDAAVFGVPDQRLGERVAALVELDPASPISAADVLRQVRGRISDYKIPEIAQLVRSLPRNANGKLDRKALPALLKAQAANASADAGRDVARQLPQSSLSR